MIQSICFFRIQRYNENNEETLINTLVLIIGHLLYDFAFVMKQRPRRKQWILLAVLTALSLIPLYLLRSRIPSVPAGIGIIAYAAILFSTIIFSKPLGTSVFMAAAVFACSDIFMVFNILTDSGFLMKLTALLIYYISLLMYGRVLNQ